MSIGVLMSVTIVAFQSLGVGTAMPDVARELGGLGSYGWAFSAFMLASVVGSVAAGGDADPPRPAAGLPRGDRGVRGGERAGRPVVVVGRAPGGARARGPGLRRAGRGHLRLREPRVPVRDVRPDARAHVLRLGPALAGRTRARGADRRDDDLALGLRLPAPLPPRSPCCSPARARRARPPRPPRNESGSGLSLGRAAVLAGGLAAFLAGLELDSPVAAVPLAAAGVALALPALRALLPAGTLRAARGLPFRDPRPRTARGRVPRLRRVHAAGADRARGLQPHGGRDRDQHRVAELEHRLVRAGRARPARPRRGPAHGGSRRGSASCSAASP